MKGRVGCVGLVLVLALAIVTDVQANFTQVEQQCLGKERLQFIEKGAKAPFIRELLGRELNQDVTSMVSWPEDTPSSAVSSIEMMSRKSVFYGHDHAISIYGNSKIEGYRTK